MELQAAVMGTKASLMVQEQLQLENLECYYWSDSEIVLAYLSNFWKRFRLYVGNQMSFIQSHTDIKRWGHVRSEDNPADIASRGVQGHELEGNKLWWEGPDFLATIPEEQTKKFSVPEEDPELKKVETTTALLTSDVTSVVEDFCKRCSTWEELIRKVTQFAHVSLKAKKANASLVEERQLAESIIWRDVQGRAFRKEVERLRGTSLENIKERTSKSEKVMVNKNSRLYKLDPFTDQLDVLRVGGRTHLGEGSPQSKHPVILPPDDHAVTLMIRKVHEDHGHPGTNWTHGCMRVQGYWILQGKRAIYKLVSKCVTRIRKRKPAEQQKMGPLPKERIEETAPFTYTGVDLFGPFQTKFSVRSVRKRWIAIFVCLYSRCIHMEVVESLETSSFLTAYRRFVNRRGPVRALWSDRGTNFIGANREIQDEKKLLNDPTLKQKLAMTSCDWLEFKFSVPKASNMNGAWERMIRTVRSAMFHALTIHRDQLTDDLLQTVVTEAEAVVNSRPMTYVDSRDPDDPTPITPAQLLTLKSNIAPPLPGVFPENERYSKKRWRYTQYLAQQFWLKWRTLIVPETNVRHKWQRERENLKTGDVVLLMEEDAPRGSWPMGLVTETMPSKDGLVRKVKLKTRGTQLERPANRLVRLLPSADDDGRTDSDNR